MTLDAHMFGDPCKVLERKQAEQINKTLQCGQCIHASTKLFEGDPFCTKVRQTYGYRCWRFKTDTKGTP